LKKIQEGVVLLDEGIKEARTRFWFQASVYYVMRLGLLAANSLNRNSERNK
jgi:hypothetical protein